jgi:hypothetical protein
VRTARAEPGIHHQSSLEDLVPAPTERHRLLMASARRVTGRSITWGGPRPRPRPRPQRPVAILLAALVVLVWAPSTAEAQSAPCGRVVAVGDSVMLGAAQALSKRGVVVDAKVSRQFGAGAPLAQAAAAGAKAVIVHLGTNGPMSYDQLDRFATSITSQGARLVLVTIQLPNVARYTYERDVNSRIWGVWATRWGVKVADWNSLSSANRSLLAGDGTHLSGPNAAKAFADLVVGVACAP